MNEAGAGPRPSPELIAEATKRAGLIWVQVPGQDRPRALWHIWAAGAAYVLTGPGEQDLPGLAEAVQVTVITPASGAHGAEDFGGLVTWDADVSRVEPGGAEWDLVIGPLLAGRLNPALGPGETSPAGRWRRTCAVRRLAPRPPRPKSRSALSGPPRAVH